MLRRRGLTTLGLGLSIAFPAAMFGQACQGVAGTWTDNWNYIWTLTQSGFNISGSVNTQDGCGPYSVSGAIDTQGNLTLGARNPASSCATVFSYTGSLSGVGCEFGSGEWQNNEGGSNTWNWSKPCDGPDYETTSTSTYGWDGTIYQWLTTAVSYSGLYFGGRTSYEDDAGNGTDSCYWDNTATGGDASQIPPQTTIPYTEFTIDWNQQSIDLIGWTPFAVGYYRGGRPSRGLPMPCNSNKYQNISMKCSNGVASIRYATNQTTAVIGTTTVESWRAGQGQTETF